MKKIYVLLFSVLALATTSCKKDKGDDSVHLKCKIDGVEKSFNTSAMAGLNTENGQSYLIALGLSAASESADYFSFTIAKAGAAPTAGTYTLDSEGYIISGQYSESSSSTVFVGGSTYTSNEDGKGFKITISRIDDKTVRGTFSGELRGSGDVSNKKTVTEGSFYLNITDQLPI